MSDLLKYPHTAKDGKWMVVVEVVDPKDQMMKGGTQFLFNSYEDCVSFTVYLGGPAGAKLKEEWLAQKAKR